MQNVIVYISHIFHQFIIIVIYDNVGFPAINSVSHIGLIMHEDFRIYELGFVCAGLSLVKYASSLLVVMVASVLILKTCAAQVMTKV